MVRKMAYVGIAYIAGLFSASFFEKSIQIYLYLGIMATTLSYFICFKKRKREIIVVALSFCLAIFANIFYIQIIYENLTNYDNKKVTFEGEIVDYSNLNNDKAIYKVKGKINEKDKATILIYSDEKECDYNDKVEFEGTLSKLENSFDFPSESYYKAKNIFLEASEVSTLKITPNNSFSAKKYILKYRDYIYQKITNILPNDEGGFLGALLCGDKASLNENVKTTLYRVGIGHIIAVSGTHLMIIAGLLLWLLKKLKINKWGRFLTVEAVILAFTVFSGLSSSVLRAGIMFTILMLGTIAKRNADTLNSIGIAGIVLTIFSPFAIRDPSLLLSLAGVFGIAVFAPYIMRSLGFKGRLKWLKNSILTLTCVSILTFPFVILFFDEVSLISPISNILLVPLCVFALVCGLIFAIFSGVGFIAYPFIILAGLSLKIVLAISSFLAKIPFSYVPLGYDYIPFTTAICVVAIVAIFLIFKTKKALISAIMTSIIMLLFSTLIFQISIQDKLQIAIFAQKNSTTIVFHKNGETGIIDFEGKGELSKTVQKYLNQKGIKSVSALIIKENFQKTASSYTNNISTKIENICCFDKEKIVLENTMLENINAGSVAKFSDFEIDFIDNSRYLIKYGNFSLLCEEKNDTILNNSLTSFIRLVISDENKEIQTKNEIVKLNFDENLSGQSFEIVAKNDGSFSLDTF